MDGVVDGPKPQGFREDEDDSAHRQLQCISEGADYSSSYAGFLINIDMIFKCCQNVEDVLHRCKARKISVWRDTHQLVDYKIKT